MWRIATAASRGLLSPRGATPNPMPDLSIPSFFEDIAGGRSTLRFARGLQAAVDPRLDHLASAGSTFSSASSPETAAEVVGSLGLASSSIAHKAREFSEGIRHYGRCYWELSKARLSMLVVATSGAGFVLGSSSSIDLAGLCCTCAGTMMVAASANSLNQVFERQNDAKMKRTRHRPLPSGRIGVPHAAMWASSVGLAGTTLLAWKANYLAAGLAASNLILYAFVYTPLKQIHPINTWVGAVVGAIPPLLGWAAASGEVSLNSMILPAALYYWQIPHFMALAYLCRNDYITGGFRMFTLADASGQRTALVSLRNCLYLLPLGFLAYDWGLTSKWFALESTLVTMSISIGALLFVRDRSSKNARRMFHGSLIYLPVFMSGLLLHRLPNEQNEMTMAEPTRNDQALTEIVDSEGSSYKKKGKDRTQTRPPIAYASVAPFPFLPAPMYFPSDS
ncbi:protoheme IX farnesyltransferase, mitochondrial [Curcuma longa]|uniref:protoheme IX farnesyltransferase, mitochondrial n=1 Tax=Curcuma longa TaxID=136217 RepID=UPI003D9EAACF